MCVNEKELHGYKLLNNIARKNSVVILGSNYIKEMPVGELKQIFGIVTDIYNRSLSDMSIFEANDIVKELIDELSPKKLVLQLGERDLMNGKHTVDEVMAEYEKVITSIRRTDKSIRLILVSLNNLTDKSIEDEYNRRLDELAGRYKAQFADITSAGSDDESRIKTFRLLKYFMSDELAFSIL